MFNTEGINDSILAITLLHKLCVITGMELISTPSNAKFRTSEISLTHIS